MSLLEDDWYLHVCVVTKCRNRVVRWMDMVPNAIGLRDPMGSRDSHTYSSDVPLAAHDSFHSEPSDSFQPFTGIVFIGNATRHLVMQIPTRVFAVTPRPELASTARPSASSSLVALFAFNFMYLLPLPKIRVMQLLLGIMNIAHNATSATSTHHVRQSLRS
jgi:hypothetical protein